MSNIARVYTFLLLNLFCLVTNFAATAEETAATEPSQTITITAVGDVMMGTDYPYNALPPNDGQELFTQSKAYIQTGDIKFANFEGTFYDGEKTLEGKAPGENHYEPVPEFII